MIRNGSNLSGVINFCSIAIWFKELPEDLGAKDRSVSIHILSPPLNILFNSGLYRILSFLPSIYFSPVSWVRRLVTLCPTAIVGQPDIIMYLIVILIFILLWHVFIFTVSMLTAADQYPRFLFKWSVNLRLLIRLFRIRLWLINSFGCLLSSAYDKLFHPVHNKCLLTR